MLICSGAKIVISGIVTHFEYVIFLMITGSELLKNFVLPVRKTLIILLLCLFSAITLWGQGGGKPSGFLFDDADTTAKKDTLVFDARISIAQQLLPLDTIIQIAYFNSPSLKYYSTLIRVRKHNMSYTRMMSFKDLSVFYNYSIGDQQIFVTGSTPVDNTQFANGYRLGINLQLPLSTVLGHWPRMKQARAELEAQRWRKEEIRLEIKREVQRLYVNMIEGQSKLSIRTIDAQVALMASNVAEEELAEGRIPPHEFSRIRNIYAIAASNVELERANFLRAFFDLEALVGVEMQQLLKPDQKGYEDYIIKEPK